MKKILWFFWSIIATAINLPVSLLAIIIALLFCRIRTYSINLNPLALILAVDRFPNFLKKVLVSNLAGIGIGSVVLLRYDLQKPNRDWLLWHELGHVRQNIILTSYLFFSLYCICRILVKDYYRNPFEIDADRYANEKSDYTRTR